MGTADQMWYHNGGIITTHNCSPCEWGKADHTLVTFLFWFIFWFIFLLERLFYCQLVSWGLGCSDVKIQRSKLFFSQTNLTVHVFLNWEITKWNVLKQIIILNYLQILECSFFFLFFLHIFLLKFHKNKTNLQQNNTQYRLIANAAVLWKPWITQGSCG